MGKIENAKRLSHYLVNDMIISSMKSCSIQTGQASVFGSRIRFPIIISTQRKQFILLEGKIYIYV